jgi:hypothetical protein
MTNDNLRSIVSDAMIAFGPAVVEKAVTAAVRVPQSDDPTRYASDVARAVERVALGELARQRRRTAIALQVCRAAGLPTVGRH